MSHVPSPESENLTQDQYVSALPRDDRGRPTAGGIALLRRLGVGGMGAVYRGEHPRLGAVAVKILPFTLIEKEPSLKDRFIAEGRTASALASPHVVRVHDVGVEGATHYLVMEYVDGESAAARLDRAGGGLPESEALDITRAAVCGLSAAHERGIVHRDLKPANILIPGGRPADAKLADLGLARPLSGDGTVGTASSITLGSPGFIAPEQALDSRKADRRSDVFSAGATLYALLTGAPPFRGATAFGALMDAALKDADPLPPTVSPAARMIVDRCLAKDASRRYADAGELLAALDEARGAAPSSRGPRSVAAKAALAAGLVPLLLLIALLVRRREPEPDERVRVVLAPGVTMEFVRIRPGSFVMGEAGVEDDETPHAVTIGRPFWMQTTEVTQAQWEALMGANPSATRGADRPVENVSWNECAEFVARVAARAGRAASLPTEAEWEYACRAGTTTRWHTGDAAEALAAACWYGAKDPSPTHAVAGKVANAWGLHDMHGNVWEWCADWYDEYPEKAVVDPKGPPAGRSRVKRGGCMVSAIESTRSANRGYNGPLHRDEALGLRVVLR